MTGVPAARPWPALLLVVLSAAAAAEGALQPLDIVTADGARHRFRVELADSPRARRRGLMYRETLAADAGMLFDFGRERPVAMWMVNTYIPLDMLFIDARGILVRIAEHTTPRSSERIASGEPVKAVLEVQAGTAARLGIAPGDRVVHPLFGGGRLRGDW